MTAPVSSAPDGPPPERSGLTHLGPAGARMVDVGAKPATVRRAVAEGWVRMRPETADLLTQRRLAKGDALTVAQVAGIQGAKRTAEWVPLAHPIFLSRVDVVLEPAEGAVRIEATVETVGPTGVEMEALTAVTAAALCLYDMAKAVDRDMTLDGIRLLEKRGGRSGTWRRAT
jgi:cyclic pyranopterin phosphate synthase